jgi:hypothetical protein
VVVVLTVALNFDSWRSGNERGSDFEREFIALTSLVLLFDAAAFLASWALLRRRRTLSRSGGPSFEFPNPAGRPPMEKLVKASPLVEARPSPGGNLSGLERGRVAS